MPTVAIITSTIGWHSRQIASALTDCGCEVYFAALPEFEFMLAQQPVKRCGFFRPQHATTAVLPDAVFVRCIPAGTLEEIVFYLDILHTFALHSVKVYNDARAIERSVDKVMTSFLLRRAGLPTPRTWAGLDPQRAQSVIEQHTGAGHALVMKPIFGSQGQGLQYIDAKSAPPDFTANTVYYLQEFISCGNGQWHDWRLFVIHHRVVATMQRVGRNWINNVAQGAVCHAAEPDATMKALAEAASVAVGADYAGVDVIADASGDYYIVEVNSIPAWRGLQQVAPVAIAKLIAADLLKYISDAPPLSDNACEAAAETVEPD